MCVCVCVYCVLRAACFNVFAVSNACERSARASNVRDTRAQHACAGVRWCVARARGARRCGCGLQSVRRLAVHGCTCRCSSSRPLQRMYPRRAHPPSHASSPDTARTCGCAHTCAKRSVGIYRGKCVGTRPRCVASRCVLKLKEDVELPCHHAPSHTHALLSPAPFFALLRANAALLAPFTAIHMSSAVSGGSASPVATHRPSLYAVVVPQPDDDVEAGALSMPDTAPATSPSLQDSVYQHAYEMALRRRAAATAGEPMPASREPVGEPVPGLDGRHIRGDLLNDILVHSVPPEEEGLPPVPPCVSESNASHIYVAARVRPQTLLEVSQGGQFGLSLSTDTPTVAVAGALGRETTYTLHDVLGPNTSQADTYHRVAHPIVEGVLYGMNGTICAYGQTSSGKTYTTFGAAGNSASEERDELSEALSTSPELKGIIPRSIEVRSHRN
ncbi:hypothetical protein EON67_08035 [archaeon]|nr:MAG: hypothetical protein EON67_08035 [archaeon]